MNRTSCILLFQQDASTIRVSRHSEPFCREIDSGAGSGHVELVFTCSRKTSFFSVTARLPGLAQACYSDILISSISYRYICFRLQDFTQFLDLSLFSVQASGIKIVVRFIASATQLRSLSTERKTTSDVKIEMEKASLVVSRSIGRSQHLKLEAALRVC